MIGEAKRIVAEYKTGTSNFRISSSSGASNEITSESDASRLHIEYKNLLPLDLDLSFDDIKMTNLAIKNLTYKDAEKTDSVSISQISLIGGKGERVNFFQNDEEIAFVFEHNGYSYKIIQSDKLKIKRRKRLLSKGDGKLLKPNETDSWYQQSNENQALTTTSIWPNKSVPTGAKPVDFTYGISVLYLVDPRVWVGNSESRIQARFTVSGKEVANDVLEQERIIDGQSGNFFRFHTACYQSSVTGKNIFAYITAPPSLCPNSRCTSNYVDLLARMNTNSDVKDLRAEWKADVVMLLHYLPDYRDNYWEGAANIPTSPTDTSFKNYANAVVYYDQYETSTYLHESFHLLGGRHSQYESQNPGKGSVKAYIGSYKDYSQTPTESVGYRSLMSYNNICTNVTGDKYCQWFHRLSSPSTQVTLFPQDKVFKLGSSLHNNKTQVTSLIRTVSNYSKN